jgi:glycosyltransferase EpsF
LVNLPEVKRVLHIVSTMDRGGAETLIMNVYRNLDKKKLQFDFITHSPKKGEFDDEIQGLGGIVYKIPSLGQLGPLEYVKRLIEIMKSKPYIGVHAHTDYQSGFPALAAKIAGIQNRICHSHSNNWLKGTKMKEKIILKILQTVIKFTATSYCSCSKEAAGFLFGKRVLENGKTNILKNFIDIRTFTNTDRNCRKSVVQELSLQDDAKIIGHVGTFSESKNQIYILNILKKLLEEDKCYVALLVGDGPLREKIEYEAQRLGIDNHIKFLGVREDIPRLMKAFNVFLFPSIFEGFGIVTLEAQGAGTPCIVSDSIPSSVDMDLGLVSFVNLNHRIEVWCQEIKKGLLIERPNNATIINKFSNKGFDIQNNVNDWLSLYGLNGS